MKAAFFLLYLIQLLPFKAIHKIADAVGILAYYAVKPRRKVGETNLRKCFPEWSEDKRKAVLKRHFQHMAKLMLEYGLYWYAPAERLRKLVHYQDKHHLDDALAAGEKVILLYPHFTAFEMAVYTLNQDVPLTSMAAPKACARLSSNCAKATPPSFTCPTKILAATTPSSSTSSESPPPRLQA